MVVIAELATGYVSIIAETSGVSKGIRKALGGVDKQGERTGRSLGSRISSGIGKTLKVGVASAGAAAGGILAGSIAKGLGRLSGIENAQAKLSGLGHEAEGVASIMDDALASVKGTSYGLEDAATIAASAVAAGIKPGEDLQRTLKLTGDTAAIAGTDLSSMGSIINKVATSDMMQMDVANQLMDAGIPILQMVGEELGVTAEEARKMASAGEISFETFQSALEEGVGGAALKAGETVQGSFANMGAAMGRFGAALMDPVFTAAPAIFTAIGDVFDQINEAIGPSAERIGELLTPALEDLAGLIETSLGPALAEGAEWLGDIAVKITEAAVDPSTWERVGGVFSGMRDVFEKLWPSIESLAGSFLTITQNISVAVWEALGAALGALAPLVETVLVPLVEKVADFAEQNPGAVQAIVMAFLGFKGVSAVAGPVKTFSKNLRNAGGAISFVGKAFKGTNLAGGLVNLMAGFKSANPIIASLGRGVATFTKALATVSKFLGPVVKFLGTAIRFVNPWVAGITLVAGALTWFFTQTETGQALWQGFTDALADGWDWVVEKLGAGWEWIQTTVFQPLMNFVTGTLVPMWESFVGGLQSAWEGLVSGLQSAWENIFRPVLEAIWQVAQVTIGVIGTIILAPLLLAWEAVSWGIQAAWENIIKPAWDAMSDAATWLWESVLSPVFTWIGEKWNQLTAILQAGWEWIKTTVFDAWNSYVEVVRSNWETVTNALTAAWQWVSDLFTSIWNAIKTAVFDAWNNNVLGVRSTFEAVTAALSAAWSWVRDTFTSVWNAIKSTVFDAWNAVVENVKSVFDAVTGAMSTAWSSFRDGLHSVWTWIDTNVFSAFRNALDSLQDFFGSIVDGIGRVWNNLRGLLAKPINFMIGTVYNDGILRAWNIIAGILPGLEEGRPLSRIPEHAAGGRITGPGTGTSDDVLMWGSNGEHMLTAREVKRLGGHAHVYAMRDFVAKGRPFSFDGSGGLIGLPRDPDNRAGDLIGAAPDLVPAFRDGGAIRPMWELQLERGHEFAKAQHGRHYQWAGPRFVGDSFDCSGYMASIAAAIQGTNVWQRYWATMAFPGSRPQGFTPGLGPGFSIGVWNGGPYGGHTSGTLGPAGPYGTVNVESGGSPSQVKYGVGAVGADHPQHKMHYHLPIGADGQFISGGEGGMSPEFMKNAISEALGSAVDTILDPIVSLLPEKPPEWQGVPRGYYEKGRDGLTDKIAEGVAGLADGLATVWSAIREIPDLIAGRIRGSDDVEDAARATLFDTGGVWKSGTLGVNLSGADEYVFTNMAMAEFSVATANLHTSVQVMGQIMDKFARDLSANADIRKAGEGYLATQASGVLDMVGLGGLVPLGLSLGERAWEAYQAAPVEVGFNGQQVTVEIDAEGGEWVHVDKFEELSNQVHGLDVKVNRKAPAATVTRGGVI